jgi:hypothetical protein
MVLDGGDAPVLNLELPDPDSDTISTMEFLARLEAAWAVCDRFDLQTEIWRGRILRAVRDREKRGGEGRGTGFLQWLREREISKTRAYTLIQLAESADALVGDGLLEEGSVNHFSKRAFLETAQADPEVQQMIAEAANEGQEITRKQVRRLADEFTAATSPLLPEEIRQRTAENLLPPRAVAPLVKELAKLPEEQQDDLRKVLREEPELERVREVTHTARWLSKAAEAALAVRAFQYGQPGFREGSAGGPAARCPGPAGRCGGPGPGPGGRRAEAAHQLAAAGGPAGAALGGKRQQHPPSAGSAHRPAVAQWQHPAGVAGGAGRGQAGAVAAGGGGA